MSASTAKERVELNPTEARRLTIALGSGCYGDNFDNPEVWAGFAHFKSKNWKYEVYKKNPDRYDEYVQKQIEELNEIVAPFVGQIAIGKTNRPAFKREKETWEQWRMSAPLFAKGSISGIEGHTVEVTRQFFGDYDQEISPSGVYGYQIGVVIDTDLPESYINHNMRVASNLQTPQVPQADQVLVPVRSFPRSDTWFHSLYSDQIKAS